MLERTGELALSDRFARRCGHNKPLIVLAAATDAELVEPTVLLLPEPEYATSPKGYLARRGAKDVIDWMLNSCEARWRINGRGCCKGQLLYRGSRSIGSTM